MTSCPPPSRSSPPATPRHRRGRPRRRSVPTRRESPPRAHREGPRSWRSTWRRARPRALVCKKRAPHGRATTSLSPAWTPAQRATPSSRRRSSMGGSRPQSRLRLSNSILSISFRNDSKKKATETASASHERVSVLGLLVAVLVSLQGFLQVHVGALAVDLVPRRAQEFRVRARLLVVDERGPLLGRVVRRNGVLDVRLAVVLHAFVPLRVVRRAVLRHLAAPLFDLFV
mmetsp:Transcript_5357/g.16939  ORF Transcript_5357/g.16939 Transcript_5357/m.16939 type:complete len:229 (+) Transcript_5357:480-1166(+)